MRNYAALLVLALLTLRCAAADPAPSPPNAQAITLAEVLPTVQPPAKGIALVVGADKDVLPDNSPAPPSGLSLAECAEAFGMITRTFGAVTAVASASMVVLNNNPGPPDLSNALTPSDAFQQLAASLTDSQWSKLTSASGLAFGDLDNSQQALWWAIFPGKTLRVAPKVIGDMDASKEQTIDLSADMPEAHIRVERVVTLIGHNRDGILNFDLASDSQPGSPQRWNVVSHRKSPEESLYGNLIRAVVENAPKPSDLKWDSPALKTLIPLNGIATVGDLVQRIANKTRLEIYADPHYAVTSVAILGADQTAPACDLLQALALCVAGTYRAVGPAFVMTDNLTGLATTREIWHRYLDDDVLTAMTTARDRAQALLYQRRGGDELPTFGPLALSKEESDPNPGHPLAEIAFSIAGGPSLPFAKLTSDQQNVARQMVARYAASHAAQMAKNPKQAPDLTGKWLINADAIFQAIVPSISQPIQLVNSIFSSQFLNPPMSALLSYAKKQEQENHDHPEKLPLPPPLKTTLAKKTHCAVLAAPRNISEVKALVAAMRKMGMDELWLSVFAGGQARIPDTPFVVPLGQNGDLLAAALAATKGTGITVYPVANLLCWGASPPQAVRDLNALGENTIEMAAREAALSPSNADLHDVEGEDTPLAGMWVSPFGPNVVANLVNLVKAVGAHPGIGGLVWQASEPRGDDDSQIWSPLRKSLGYSEPERLAFLRANHADPLDITAGSFARGDYSIPTWDNKKVGVQLGAAWEKFRDGVDTDLLHRLYDVAKRTTTTAAALPIFLKSREDDNFTGGVLPPGPWPVDGSLPTAKPNVTLPTILVQPGERLIELEQRLGSFADSNEYDGFGLDIIPSDGGMGAAGFDDFAEKAGK